MISIRGVVDDREVVNLTVNGLNDLVKRPMGHAINRWRPVLVKELTAQLAGESLAERSGELQRTTTLGPVKISGDDLTVEIITQVPYALIYQERSAADRTIYPTEGHDFLTVPIPHNYKGTHPRPLADYPEKATFLKPRAKGGFVVFERRVPRSASVPIYLLTPSVKLPYRPWLRRALNNSLPKLDDIISNITGKAARVRR